MSKFGIYLYRFPPATEGRRLGGRNDGRQKFCNIMMKVRNILRGLIFLVGIGIVAYGLKTIPLKNIGQQIAQNSIYMELSKKASFLPDWTNDQILEKINAERQAKGLNKVKINEKLNQAALLRLSIILSEDDYSGAKTGLTREKAVKNAGYSASLVGDLALAGFFKTNDPIAYWESETTSKETLLHRDFKEIGIAIKNERDTVSVYVLFVAPAKAVAQPVVAQKTAWGGIELWAAINKRRVELGVNPLGKKDELCTIASIRLNQLLELGKLDGHAGFVPVLDRPDLKWISEKYNISEFLAEGYPTPEATVMAWENTLGHKALVAGGEYVWGCVYAQNTFAVALAAY